MFINKFFNTTSKESNKLDENKEKYIEDIIYLITMDKLHLYRNLSEHYIKLRKEIIEKELFYKIDFKSIEDSCKSFFKDNIKPDTLENTIKCEYIGYLFHYVFFHILFDKYQRKANGRLDYIFEDRCLERNRIDERKYYIMDFPALFFKNLYNDGTDYVFSEMILKCKENNQLYKFDEFREYYLQAVNKFTNHRYKMDYEQMLKKLRQELKIRKRIYQKKQKRKINKIIYQILRRK